MKTRIKVNLPLLQSRDDAEAAMNDLALAINNQRKLIAKRDGQVLLINQQYESPLGELDETIKAQTDSLRAWAERNPDMFPKGRKSVDLVAGTLGFRTGTPKLALLSRAFNWDKVLELLKLRLTNFIRVKREVDKDGILAAHAARKLDETQLAAIGVKVTQEESFYIEPNLTPLETRQTQESV